LHLLQNNQVVEIPSHLRNPISYVLHPVINKHISPDGIICLCCETRRHQRAAGATKQKTQPPAVIVLMREWPLLT
jgi:hypothetical protein